MSLQAQTLSDVKALLVACHGQTHGHVHAVCANGMSWAGTLGHVHALFAVGKSCVTISTVQADIKHHTHIDPANLCTATMHLPL